MNGGFRPGRPVLSHQERNTGRLPIYIIVKLANKRGASRF